MSVTAIDFLRAAVEDDLLDCLKRAERAHTRQAKGEPEDVARAFADERTWLAQGDALRRTLERMP